MRQQLLAKQQELLKIQQQRLELELAEAKSRLHRQDQPLVNTCAKVLQWPNYISALQYIHFFLNFEILPHNIFYCWHCT